MEELAGFAMEEGRAVYRPVGSVSFTEAVALIRSAIALARSRGARDLLVDATALTGFRSPSTAKRFFAVEQWAEEAGGVLPVALAARAEVIDPKKFGVTVAANRGFESDIFTTETEARAWLDARRRPMG